MIKQGKIKMKVIVFGASGMIGQRILDEIVSRGYEATAVARDVSKIPQNKKVTVKAGDILDHKQVETLLADHDIAINATSPGGDTALLSKAAKALIEGFTKKKGGRLLVVGGAGSLEVTPGVQLVDTPTFPAMWKGVALAHRDALNTYKSSNINWTYLSPPAMIQPGTKTGKYRLGDDQLLLDANGESKISAEDYAVAVVDEIEKPKHERRRFTVAY